MKLRWQFFVIVFVFSLIPLLMVTVISQRGARRLGRIISTDLRQNLTSLTSEALLQAVENSSKTLPVPVFTAMKPEETIMTTTW